MRDPAVWILLGLALAAVVGAATGVISVAGGVGLAGGAILGLVLARSRRRR